MTRRSETTSNSFNGVWLWLKKRWFIAPVLLIIGGGLVSYGQHEATQDSILAKVSEENVKAGKERKENADNINVLLRKQDVTLEFFRLFKPEIFREATENVDSNNVNGDTVPADTGT